MLNQTKGPFDNKEVHEKKTYGKTYSFWSCYVKIKEFNLKLFSINNFKKIMKYIIRLIIINNFTYFFNKINKLKANKYNFFFNINFPLSPKQNKNLYLHLDQIFYKETIFKTV